MLDFFSKYVIVWVKLLKNILFLVFKGPLGNIYKLMKSRNVFEEILINFNSC